MSQAVNTFARSRRTAALGLPPSWYLDAEIFDCERRRLFASAPRFVGRAELIRKDGDYYALEGVNEGLLLVRHQGELRLVSNVCRHRQALMLNGCGNAKHIVCPIHNWAYKLDGCQIAAPHFPENPRLDLPTEAVSAWRGMLFTGEADAAADFAAVDRWQDFQRVEQHIAGDYVLDRVDHEEHALNWKAFMEVFLESYHVEAVHPGFRKYLENEDIRRMSRALAGERFFCEIASIHWPLASANSVTFAEYQRLLLELSGGVQPSFGALWLAYFPSTLIEWYPYAHIVTHYDPLGPERTRLTSQYYFRRDVHELRPDFVAASHAMFAEVTDEDHEASVRLHAGRRALWTQGVERQGPYQAPMEQGLRHFHQYLRDSCSRDLASDVS